MHILTFMLICVHCITVLGYFHASFWQVYYARVSAIAKLETITMLKKQLQLSSFDKKFLLRQIQENSQVGHLKGRKAEKMTITIG